MTEQTEVTVDQAVAIMTEAERDGYIAKGGEFGELVAKLSRRCIDAETELESLRRLADIQRQRIAELEASLAAATDDAAINREVVGRMAAVLRSRQPQQTDVRGIITGAPPAKPRDAKVIQMAATDAIERALQAG